MTLFRKWIGPNGTTLTGKRSQPTGDTVAWFTSLGLHLLLLVCLAAASMVVSHDQGDFALSFAAKEVLEEEAPLPQEFLAAEEPSENIGALSRAGDASARATAMVIEDQSLVVFEPETITDFGQRMTIEIDAPIFQGPELTNESSVQGFGSVGTTGALGAIDLITREILTSVEQQPTLVVWLFDQSGSLRDERKRILRRFRGIYEQLGVIEAANDPAFKRHQDKPLLTAVVGFGETPVMLTPKATDKMEEIEAAVEAIEDDSTGRENVFHAIGMVAEKFRSYRLARNGRRNVMIVIFTDEAGDDAERAEATIDLCRKLAMPVYVVGRPAPLGRRTAYVKWVDPDPNFDQRPQWVPVNLGPETVMPERLKLHFLGAGQGDELLDSGYGPYALTRLCYETHGLYFASHPNRAVGRRISGSETDELAAHIGAFFDPDVMRRYQPDYIPIQEYQRRLRSNRAYRGLVEAAQLSWTSPIEDIRTRFPKRDEATFAVILSRAQRAAAIRQPKIDRICQVLLTGEPDREKVTSPRWQAGYDLAIGRALAMKVRTDGYNAVLAQAKQGMAFQDEKHNTWRLVVGESFANSSLANLAEKARMFLERVLEEHPDTPWALLAKRELRDPLGWRWKESYTYIPPLVEGVDNGIARRREPREPSGPTRRAPPPL